MNHTFNVEVATKIGTNAAIILENLAFWIDKNKANGKHFHDGAYWTYNSMKAFQELFPYMTVKQVRTALDMLKNEGYIATGNYNKVGYDRTLWYTITEKGYALYTSSNSPASQNDLPCEANGSALEGEPIPDIKPDSKPDIKPKKRPSTPKATKANVTFPEQGKVQSEIMDEFCKDPYIKNNIFGQTDSNKLKELKSNKLFIELCYKNCPDCPKDFALNCIAALKRVVARMPEKKRQLVKPSVMITGWIWDKVLQELKAKEYDKSIDNMIIPF